MGGFRGVDADLGWIRRRFEKIEKQIREQAAAKRLQASTIGAGGITVKDGGFLKAYYATGQPALRLGPVNSTPENPAGDGFALAMIDETDAAMVVLGAMRLPPSVTFPSGYSEFFGTAQQVYIQSEDLSNGLHVDNGQVYLFSDDQAHIYAPNGVTAQHTTTGSAANTVIDAVTGLIQRSTSSRKYKKNIKDAKVDPAAVLKMRARTYRDKNGSKDSPTHVGFIAEELHDLGLGAFVVYGEDGKPDAISYDRLSVALLAVLKDQERRIAALESADERPAEA